MARRPSSSTVVGSAQWRSSARTRLGVVAAVWASQVTSTSSVRWRRARASTSGRAHRSSAASPRSGATSGRVSLGRPALCSRLLQFAEPILGRLVRVEAEQLLEHAPDRPQRDVAVIRRAVGLEHGATLEAYLRRQLSRQRRLPDAGHAPDDDHVLLRPRRARRRGRAASR